MAYLIALWEVNDPVFKEIDHNNQVEQLQPRILDSLIMQIGILTEQGAEAEPKSVSGRITFVFALIAVMFLFTAYSANIVALLQSTTDSTNTIEGLFDSKMDLGVQNDSFIENMFKLSTDPLVKVAYEKIFTKEKQKSMSLEEGVAKIRNGFFAFQTDPSSAYKEIAKTFDEGEKCSLMETYQTSRDWNLKIASYNAFTPKNQNVLDKEQTLQVQLFWIAMRLTLYMV
ncbi:unnamed protein product [Diabrotica balteata]|uniref:Ionotropic glutamate receptor C-terminal domain-containing protein n=1 Tax=Diabrotica balteata TaxID=107213 RepID=A0A9N9SW73_DIABA|nr:unnamed protein product [Diabrotica balteata]